MTGVRVREMVYDDCDRVAEIRVTGWRTAYAGLVPRSYLDSLDIEEDAARHRARFTSADGSAVNLIAEHDGKPVGWSCHGPYRDGDTRTADAELYAIYVDPAHWGRGAGQALLAESLHRCTAASHPRMLLWVLQHNTPARRFYERSGFRPDGTEEPFEVDGVPVPEVRYARRLTPG
nr:GNAT family N-acetyltransferase [Streptomyces sp. SBE_14.2]